MKAAAAQRTAIDPFCHRVTRPVRRRIPECALSITFVVPRQRLRAAAIPIALTVKSSLSPSLRLPAAPGCCVSTQEANYSILALPALASSFHAALSTDLG